MKIAVDARGKTEWLYFLILFLFAMLPASSQNVRSPLNIGFLIPSEKSDEAVNGAILAASVINGKGGIKGRPLEIIVRSMEGPWGMGSKQAVNAIFEDNVAAVIGFTDGRNGHLVEQACTKTGVLFISCLASDPTLAQAFVPWFFNCVPDDQQQAIMLNEDIFIKNRFTRVAVIAAKDYDSQSSLKYFDRIYNRDYKSESIKISFHNIEDKETFFSNLKTFKPQCILILCSSSKEASLIAELKNRDIKLPLYGNLYLAVGNPDLSTIFRDSGIRLRIPYFERFEKEYLWFFNEFKKKYNSSPGIAAELSYDAVSLLAEALKTSGYDREALQNYLLKTDYKGVTGYIGFDERGRRKGTFKILDF